jgi:hypothetical protein
MDRIAGLAVTLGMLVGFFGTSAVFMAVFWG